VRQWPSWSPPPTRGVSVLNWACDAADLTKCANDCAFVASAKPHDRCVMRSVVRGYQYGFTLDENVSTAWLPYWFTASVLGRTTDIMLHGP
jgi:hypothetical protein